MWADFHMESTYKVSKQSRIMWSRVQGNGIREAEVLIKVYEFSVRTRTNSIYGVVTTSRNISMYS